MKLKESMGKHDSLVKNIISFIGFMFIFIVIFSKITYLFRNTDMNRLRMMGLHEEENLDVIYIGGSSTYVYFEPLKAWNDCGFTSYDYATATQQLDGPEFYIKEALKTQNPSLFIIEMRPFVSYNPSISEPSLRNGSDSMSWWSINRWNYIHSYLTYHPANEDTDVVSYYFDIAKYHTNLTNLSNQTAWKCIGKVEPDANKGFSWFDEYDRLAKPANYLTDERIGIPQECVELLNRLLDYCDEQNLQVLFILSPKYVSADEMGKYNTLKDIIEARGYKFLNTNEFYDEMSLDFSMDFFSVTHVNCFGAEKYTQFLEEYLVSNYDLPDHRGESAYSSWDEAFIRFSEEEIKHKSLIAAKQEDYDKSLKLEEEIVNTTDFKEWSGIVKEPRYYVFFAQKGVDWGDFATVDEMMLNSFGLDGTGTGCSVFNTSVIKSDTSTGSFELSGIINENNITEMSYYINNIEGQASIMISEIEYSPMDDGINVVVVDTILGRVVDSATLSVNDEGNIYVRRFTKRNIRCGL